MRLKGPSPAGSLARGARGPMRFPQVRPVANSRHRAGDANSPPASGPSIFISSTAGAVSKRGLNGPPRKNVTVVDPAGDLAGGRASDFLNGRGFGPAAAPPRPPRRFGGSEIPGPGRTNPKRRSARRGPSRHRGHGLA